MNIDKICRGAKELIALAERLELTREELSAMTMLVSSEMSQRYIEQLQRESDKREKR